MSTVEVILLESIRKLGSLGKKVKVKGGFARNYLIPSGKAVPATAANEAEFEARRQELEQTVKAEIAAAEARVEQLNDTVVSIAAKAGDEGKLFGSVGTRNIAEAITALGIKVEKKEVILPQDTIRNIGEYEILLQLHSEVSTRVKLVVVAE